MAFEFNGTTYNRRKDDQCKASGNDHQCTRKPWRDGWCKTHHPDTIKAKDDARQAKWDAQRKAWDAQRKAEQDRYEARVKAERDGKMFPDAVGLLRECLTVLDDDGDLADRISEFLRKAGV